jgi:hypothetical protein
MKMPSSGLLRRVALVRTDVSEEGISSIRITKIGELGTTLPVTSNRATRRHIAEGGILLLHYKYRNAERRIFPCISLNEHTRCIGRFSEHDPYALGYCEEQVKTRFQLHIKYDS